MSENEAIWATVYRLELPIGLTAEGKDVLKLSIRKLDDAIQDVNDKIQNICEQFDEMTKALSKAKNDADETEKEYTECIALIRKHDEERNELRQKLLECNEKMSQQGIPEKLEKFDNVSTKKCRQELSRINTKISKLGGVNLKAIDTLEKLQKDKEHLDDRIEHIKKAVRRGEQVCEQLDDAKVEKIDFTFKQVGKYFTEIFKIMVPQGEARLNFDRHDTDPNNNRPTSVTIRVSFNGGNREMTALNQLSGGQKSIVALAYTFALQKCDPSPVYIFDEIDANLDAQSRRRVADWLLDSNRSSQDENRPSSQFITTSFRRELVEKADKIIGVNMVNRASKVMSLTLFEAMEFITQQEQIQSVSDEEEIEDMDIDTDGEHQ